MYTRSFLHLSLKNEGIASRLVTYHNICYMMRLMTSIRDAIIEQRFPQFVREFMDRYFIDQKYPLWVVEALHDAGIDLLEAQDSSNY